MNLPHTPDPENDHDPEQNAARAADGNDDEHRPASEPPPLPASHAASPPPPPTTSNKPTFSNWWPLLGGALIGLILRAIFSGEEDGRFSPMLPVFLLLAPLAVGAVTVYLAERVQPRSLGYYVLAPMISTCLFVLGSMAMLWEGAICAILILPVFMLVGAFGGLIMGVICRMKWKSRRPTVYSFVALPVVLAALGIGNETPQRFEHVERSTLIQAAPAEVWKHLLDADHIRASEVDRAWMYRIGVPTPLAGVTHRSDRGLVREVRMGKGIHFRQMSSDWQPHRYVRWQYLFEEDSVPAGALDDHVRIGGEYFDLRDTTYTLTPRGDATVLTIRMDYRVSTGFNWYAVPLADWLIGDFSEVILDFYRQRAQARPAA